VIVTFIDLFDYRLVHTTCVLGILGQPALRQRGIVWPVCTHVVCVFEKGTDVCRGKWIRRSELL
jgi:hypothetical protein